MAITDLMVEYPRLTVLAVVALLTWVAAIVMVRLSNRDPSIMSLRDAARKSVAVAAATTISLFGFTNMRFGYPWWNEDVNLWIIFFVVVGFSLPTLYFLFQFLTGRFDRLNAALAFDAYADGLLVSNRAGQIVFANSAAERMFAYAKGEMLDVSIEDLVPDSLRDLHRQHRDIYAEQPVARPMGIGLEIMAQRKDKTEFPAEIGLTPIQTSTGLLVYATVVDIGPRKKIAESLAGTEVDETTH